MAGLRNYATTLSEILLAIKNQITIGSAYGGGSSLLSDSLVFIALEEDQVQPPPDDNYLVLIPGTQQPDMPAIGGAAAATITPFNGEFGAIFWARLSIDQAGRDDSYITDKSLGVLELWRKIMKALQLWDPVNVNGDYLLEEPMRMTAGGFRFGKRVPRTGWGAIAASFEVHYLADLVS
jgi:hypothetical protein